MKTLLMTMMSLTISMSASAKCAMQANNDINGKTAASHQVQSANSQTQQTKSNQEGRRTRI